jgi:hypothetical protein
MRCSKVCRQALDDPLTPALFLLPGNYLPANFPVGLDDDVVDGPGRAQSAGREGLEVSGRRRQV